MPTTDFLLDTYERDIIPTPELLARIDAAKARIDAAERECSLARADLRIAEAELYTFKAIARHALLDALYVKVGQDGEPVPRPGAPRGPRQRTEDAATIQANAPTLILSLGAEGMKVESAEVTLDDLGWPGDVQMYMDPPQPQILLRHRITWDEFGGWTDDYHGAKAGGNVWTMDDEPRVVS